MRDLELKQRKEALAKKEIKKSCGNKNCYRTKGYAQYCAALTAKFTDSGKLEVYKCAFGKHYHIGHKPRTHVDRETRRELMS